MLRKLLFAVFAMAFAIIAAQPVAASSHQSTIVEIAIADDRFETLVAAVVATDLVDTLSSGQWTVFAPTDDAFAKLGLDASNIATAFTTEELTDILLYHVIPGEFNADKAAANVGDVVMANGAKAGLKVFAGNIYVNDTSKVIIANVDASNGVIHAVDNVILGPWPADNTGSTTSASTSAAAPSGNTIVDLAIADGRFTTLVAAVVAADLVDALSSGQWTVFAPTDDAFAKLGLNADNIATAFTTEELTDILLYHVLVGEFNADKAAANVGDVVMANGDKAGLKVFAGNIYVNDISKVIIANVDASNGVIHAVDNVILGPWPAID